MRYQRKGVLAAAALIAASLIATPISAQRGFYLETTVDCGQWIKARRLDLADVWEAYLLALLDGMVLGSGIEFWKTRGIPLTRDQVYLWMDNYCGRSPLSNLIVGADELMAEQTDGAWRRYLKRREQTAPN